MSFFIIVLGCILAIFSTIILSYISIATMVGPWIAPTVVLITSIIIKLRKRITLSSTDIKSIITIQAIASGGGVIAVGVGFALPVLYFLAPDTFNNWLADHNHFCSLIASTCLSSGSFGIFLGRMFAPKVIKDPTLPFPVSQLTYRAATSQTQDQQSKMFLGGIATTLSTCFIRDGIGPIKGFIPKSIHFFQKQLGKELTFSIWPMLWAIGYTIGIGIAFPLLIGVASKYCILNPLNYHSYFLPFKLFTPFPHLTFATAFCSGLVLAEVTLGLIRQSNKIKPLFQGYLKQLKLLKPMLKQLVSYSKQATSKKPKSFISALSMVVSILEPIGALASYVMLFSYLEFSALAQLCFLIFTAIATYEICSIGCQIGLVQFGRFSAFVLIPMILLFNINFVQITAVCVFFNVCAAAASDLLFDYKTGSYCNIDKSTLHIAQWIGLVVTSISIGFILHLLFTQLQLGSAELFAHRGRSKALLIKSLNLDPYVVLFGAIYGFILKRLKVSPTMTLGGIIMPNNITMGLIIGGIINHFTHKHQAYYLPFVSGVFASETLWIIITLIANIA